MEAERSLSLEPYSFFEVSRGLASTYLRYYVRRYIVSFAAQIFSVIFFGPSTCTWNESPSAHRNLKIELTLK